MTTAPHPAVANPVLKAERADWSVWNLVTNYAHIAGLSPETLCELWIAKTARNGALEEFARGIK